MNKLKGVSAKITGGLRSTLEVRTRLEQCIEIQKIVCGRTLLDSPEYENASKTLDLLANCLDSNAADVAKWEAIVSKHKRAYGIK